MACGRGTTKTQYAWCALAFAPTPPVSMSCNLFGFGSIAPSHLPPQRFSFDLGGQRGGRDFLGDLVVCTPTVSMTMVIPYVREHLLGSSVDLLNYQCKMRLFRLGRRSLKAVSSLESAVVGVLERSGSDLTLGRPSIQRPATHVLLHVAIRNDI